MLQRNDYLIAALVGFFTGVFAIPVLFNLGFKSGLILAAVPLIIPLLFAFGVWFSGFLSRWLSFMTQFGKFVAVGSFNTAIDFGVLNLLSLTTGITSGFIVGGVNAPGFAVAIMNSYFWNKLWVFKNRDEGETLLHDFPKFLAVSFVGLFLNSGIVILITTFVPRVVGYYLGFYFDGHFYFGGHFDTSAGPVPVYAPEDAAVPLIFGISNVAWLNIAKALATGLVLGWNFVGYKFLVFRSAGTAQNS